MSLGVVIVITVTLSLMNFLVGYALGHWHGMAEVYREWRRANEYEDRIAKNGE